VEIRQLELAVPLDDAIGDRLLAPQFLGRLVLAQALVRGSAQPAVVRPFGELHLADELRLDPHDVALAHLGHLRDLFERRTRSLQRPELVEQLLDLLAVEAGADVARVDELAAAVIAEDEGAEARRAPSRSLREATDHELLLAVGLDLQPV